jgi:hypothetical protein
MLFMLKPGRALCCCGGAYVGLPIPGFSGLMAGKEELSDERVLPDVLAFVCP